jgi:hypothetical protein
MAADSNADMATVADTNGRYLGCIMRRFWAGNGRAISFEGFSADEKSLGLFETQDEAAAAIMRRCAP